MDVTQKEEYGRKLRKDSGKTAGQAWLKNNPYEVKMSKKDNKGKRYLTLTRTGSNISSASCSLEHFSYAYKNAPESSIKPSYHYITLAIIYKSNILFKLKYKTDLMSSCVFFKLWFVTGKMKGTIISIFQIHWSIIYSKTVYQN